MRILKARLAELERREREEEMDEHPRRAQGRRLRLADPLLRAAPYQMVKDHRTGVEVGDLDAVLDGDLDRFIEAELRRRGLRARAD